MSQAASAAAVTEIEMDRFTRTDLSALCNERKGPCVSLYLPTHPGGRNDDVLRFGKLVDDVAERLPDAGLRGSEAEAMLQPLVALRDDDAFWRRTSNGLAVFVADGFTQIFHLPITVRESVAVEALFHVTPLLPLLQGEGRFYVLALSQNHVRLWRGTKEDFETVEIPHVPQNIATALRHHDRDEVLTAHSRMTSGGRWGAIYEGHGVGIDDAKDDLRRFFQAVDHGLQTTLRGERAPMVLACVDYLAPIYRDVNSYPHLLESAVHGNPDRIPPKELHAKAWASVAPTFARDVAQATELYHRAAAHGRATADAPAIIRSAFRGEVATLFVANDARLLGTIDPRTGAVTRYERPSPGAADLINLAAVHTLRHGNQVYVLPSEDMPTGGPLAAIDHLPIPKHGKEH